MNSTRSVAGLTVSLILSALGLGSVGFAQAESRSTGAPGLAVDLPPDATRPIVIDRDPGQYLGHPTTVLLGDGRTILAVYPQGHGAGPIVLKRSDDGGRTWSPRLPTPDNWTTGRETPTIHRLIDPRTGQPRLVLFSGLYPLRSATSEDEGRTWTELRPVGDWGGIVTMASCVRLAGGAYAAFFHDDGRFLHAGGKASGTFTVLMTTSTDGGQSWSGPRALCARSDVHLCEPGVVRSPDGRQLVMLLRENSRQRNSHVMTSDDEGATWSAPREMPPGLTGDRHVALLLPGGRCLVTFRDTARDSDTKGDWVAWVGPFADLAAGRDTGYRVRLMDNLNAWDCGYAALEQLQDGTIVATSYGHWENDAPPYVVCRRFQIAELDDASGRRAELPDSRGTIHRPGGITLLGPVSRWDEGLPLGNGLIGTTVWGDGKHVRLSLDRGDLWDLRVPETLQRADWTWATIRDLVAKHDQRTISDLFDRPYDEVPWPTKLPAGRIELDLPHGAGDARFDLDTRQAWVTVGRPDGTGRTPLATTMIRVDPSAPVVLIETADQDASLHLVPPGGVSRLGFPPATSGQEGGRSWFVQPTLTHDAWAVMAETRALGNTRCMAATVTFAHDSADPLVLARRILDEAWARRSASHPAESRPRVLPAEVHLPSAGLEWQYDLARHLYQCGSVKGAPPIPLQGIWTADEGGLPPWKGDFHNDLNTQTTYLASHAAGLTDATECFLDFNTTLLPRYREFARTFYGVLGAAVPGVMALDGQPLGGWCQYSLSPTMGAWVAQSFVLHWRYTADPRFLRERAYPFCSEIGTALLALLRPDARGKLVLPLSSSPEIFDNSARAWLEPNSNFDLALLRWLFGSLAEMADATGDATGAARWRDAWSKLDAFDLDTDGGLTFARGVPYRESHRHFSHALAFHPLGVLSYDDPAARRIIDATLDRLLAVGTQGWVGYSFAWMSCLLARANRAEAALDLLEKYERAFTLRNGFHCNGDQSGEGLSGFTYRPVTLEGNFLAMQAIHEMFLQSQGGVVRVFPAVSLRWPDVAFENLRAEGGFVVSASRRQGRTEQLSITALRGGKLRLRDPFTAGDHPAAATWSRPVERSGLDVVVTLAPGDVLTGRLDH